MSNTNFDYFWKNPPNCIKGFKLKPVKEFLLDSFLKLNKIEFDGHGDDSTVFELECICGSTKGMIFGYYEKLSFWNTVFLGPLSWKCTACGRITKIIDTDIHGYDSEFGQESFTERGEGESTNYICKNCNQPTSFISYARFEYAEDLFELSTDYSKMRGKEKDYFSWFSLIGKCTNCNKMSTIADFECA